MRFFAVLPPKNELSKRKDRALKKLCYVCSSGGHWEEALLLQCKLDSIPSLTVTEHEHGIPETSRGSVYTFHPLRRTDPLLMLRIPGVFFRSLVLLRREKVSHVAAFGALLCLPVCLAAKCLRIPVLYVESIARVEDLSLTGKLIYPLADRFVVQWEELLERYPKATYRGQVY